MFRDIKGISKLPSIKGSSEISLITLDLLLTLLPGHTVVVVAAKIAMKSCGPLWEKKISQKTTKLFLKIHLHVLHSPEEAVQVTPGHPRLTHLQMQASDWLRDTNTGF